MRRIAANVVVQVNPEHGEGPAWLEDSGRLLWVDITRSQVHMSDPEDGSDEVIDVGQPVGAAVPRSAGGLALALADGFAARDEDGTIRMLAPVTKDQPEVRFNDGKCDPAGRFLAGTMAYDARAGAGALYRLDPDGSVTQLLKSVTISNGLAWTADGRTMYYIDTPTLRVDRFAYDLDSGTISDRRSAIDIASGAGLPDGMAIDTDGCLWVALFGGGAVHRYTPAGTLDAVIELPVTQVTSCAFGGAALDVLYITTSTEGLDAGQLPGQPLAGAVFAADSGVSGFPTQPYAG